MVIGMLGSLLPLTALPTGATTGDLVITGVVDGPLAGGLPKAVELYVANDIPDLSIYGAGSANNGNPSTGPEFTFPAIAATAGDFVYLATEGPGFTSFFGFAPDFIHGQATNINGGRCHRAVPGRRCRRCVRHRWHVRDRPALGIHGRLGLPRRRDRPGRAAFTPDNWSFSGPNALDNETSNATAAVPFPIGTYAEDETPPPTSVIINGVDADTPGTDAAEFVEIYDGGAGTPPFTGLPWSSTTGATTSATGRWTSMA